MTSNTIAGVRGLVVIAIALFVLGGVPARAAAPEGPATRGTAASQPSTQPAEDLDARWGEAEVARRLIDAGDGRAVATILSWLASEPDGRCVGMGSGRLREAVRGAEALAVADAAPRLVALAEAPEGPFLLRWDVALAAIRVAPGDSPEFLRAVMGWESPTAPGASSAAPAAAAGAMVTTRSDEPARRFLVAGYQKSLTERAAGRPFNDTYAGEISRLADHDLRDRVLKLATVTGRADLRAEAEGVAEQMRVNGLPEEALLATCADERAPADGRRRAVIALGRRGGPAALDRLAAVAKVCAPRAAEGGGQAERFAGEAALGEEAARAVDAIRRRHRLGHAGDVSLRATWIPERLPAGTEVWLHEGSARSFHGRPAAVTLGNLDGRYRLVRGSPANERVAADARAIGPWEIVAATFDPVDPARVTAIAPYEPRPGETARDGYVLVERRSVTDGRTTRGAVVLAKLGRRVVARIPNRTRPGGATVPDATISRALERLSPGDPVEARLEETGGLTMLAWIGPYRPSWPARFVRRVDVPREGGAVPGVVLSVARRERTFVMPPPGPRPPALGVDSWPQLMPDFEMRVTAESDDGEGAAVLRDLRLEGAIGAGLNGDGPKVGVRSGRGSWNGTAVGWAGRGGEVMRLQAALGRRAAPGAGPPVTPEKVAAVRGLYRGQALSGSGAVSKFLAEQTEAWSREDDPHRREAIEQQVFLALQAHVAAIDAEEAEWVARTKELLGAEKFGELLEFGASRPPVTTRRATRPGFRPEPRR